MNPPNTESPDQCPKAPNPRTAAKNRWLAKCRSDPDKSQHLKDLRHKYYETHKEEERAKALERYYRRKARASSETPAPPSPPGV